MQQLWKEYLRAVLLGTSSNKKAVELAKKQLIHYELFSEGLSKEKTLLKAMSLNAQLQVGAAEVKRAAEHEYVDVDKEIEHLEFIPVKLLPHLQLIIRNNLEDFLLEVLELIVAKKMVLSYEILGTVLTYANSRKAVQVLLKQCMGKRGQWLCQKNKKWTKLYLHQSTIKNQAQFLYGSLEERLEYLETLKAQNPLNLLKEIEGAWKGESAEVKIQFLALFEGVRFPELITFLESKLKERSREVRKVIIQTLLSIEGSEQRKILQSFFDKYLSYNIEKQVFEINFPQDCPLELSALTLGSKKNNLKIKQEKYAYVLTLAQLLPIDFWPVHYNCSLQELLLGLQNDIWGNIFYTAWLSAALNEKREDWIIAIHQLAVEQTDRLALQHSDFKFSFAQMNDSSFSQVISLHLKGKRQFSDYDVVVDYLSTEGKKWSKELTLVFFKILKNTIAASSYAFSWKLKIIVSKAAYLIPVDCLEEINRDWPEQSRSWASWQGEIDKLISVLHFRKEIHQILQ